jgi:hypothetical protein
MTPNGKNPLDQAKKIEYIGNTFDEIIKRDKNFGSLLLKIKSAYDSYLEKVTKGKMSRKNSPEAKQEASD